MVSCVHGVRRTLDVPSAHGEPPARDARQRIASLCECVSSITDLAVLQRKRWWLPVLPCCGPLGLDWRANEAKTHYFYYTILRHDTFRIGSTQHQEEEKKEEKPALRRQPGASAPNLTRKHMVEHWR